MSMTANNFLSGLYSMARTSLPPAAPAVCKENSRIEDALQEARKALQNIDFQREFMRNGKARIVIRSAGNEHYYADEKCLKITVENIAHLDFIFFASQFIKELGAVEKCYAPNEQASQLKITGCQQECSLKEHGEIEYAKAVQVYSKGQNAAQKATQALLATLELHHIKNDRVNIQVSKSIFDKAFAQLQAAIGERLALKKHVIFRIAINRKQNLPFERKQSANIDVIEYQVQERMNLVELAQFIDYVKKKLGGLIPDCYYESKQTIYLKDQEPVEKPTLVGQIKALKSAERSAYVEFFIPQEGVDPQKINRYETLKKDAKVLSTAEQTTLPGGKGNQKT